MKCSLGISQIQSESENSSVVSISLWPHGLSRPWNSPGHNIGMGSLSLLQGIFPTQGWKPGLPHCRRVLYQLSHNGSPRIREWVEWVAYHFSSGSSRPRNWTGDSCIAGQFFTNWTIREAPINVQFFSDPLMRQNGVSNTDWDVEIINWILKDF